MKKLILGLCLMGVVMPSLADDTGSKINTVKQLYTKQGMNNGNAALERLASADLKALLRKDAQASNGEVGCIDYDVVVQGQDFDANEISRSITYTALSNGNVQVRFKNSGETSTLQYKLACTANNCKIDDVLTENGRSSFKRELRQCLSN